VRGFESVPEPKRKSIHVAEQILRELKSGGYKPGQLLPSERQLARGMDVSRNAVREALSALQISGIVETKVGVGTCVKSIPGNGATLEVLSLHRDTEDLIQIWEARKEIEIALLRLAIRRASTGAIERIEKEIEDMQRAVLSEDTFQYLAANDRFHRAIADSAENGPLAQALSSLMRFTNAGLLDETNRGYAFENLEKSLEEHVRICDAIRAKDLETGIEAVTTHFDELEAYLQRRRPLEGIDYRVLDEQSLP